MNVILTCIVGVIHTFTVRHDQTKLDDILIRNDARYKSSLNVLRKSLQALRKRINAMSFFHVED